ncbi:hypothetical protein DSL72_007976 [Monilinia vaccinii-corymbosi]|uniref:Uncharacterized protein n=1 Tax=Monilinia vaccinii-corymbosi TaxID=61207 RepID=A0A8A3PIK6_9HELO|nr:hypothetical protein DSL72_007976 [Monilinia vaccinii-corymbosi]
MARQQHHDDIEAQNHRQQLSLQDREIESRDDDIRKCTQATRWQRGAYGNQAITVHLHICKCVFHMLDAEFAVLHAGLIGAYTFDHQLFVCLAETFGAHRGVGHPEQDEHTPEEGETGVRDEDGLPGFEGAGFEEGEAVG